MTKDEPTRRGPTGKTLAWILALIVVSAFAVLVFYPQGRRAPDEANTVKVGVGGSASSPAAAESAPK